MARVINPPEFRGNSPVEAARGLLGKMLVRTAGGGRVERMITEVEAYDGEHDLACHASKGRTKRAEVMYQPGGVWYVYLCYGVHEMLNLVVGAADYPAAVLIRGVAGLAGPGRLTKALGIDRSLNAAPAHPESGLHIEDGGIVVPKRLIIATPRIGVAYAGPIWAAKKWRFTFDPTKLPQVPRALRSRVRSR